MSLYLARAAYNSEGFKGMVSNPQDRAAAVKGLATGLGIEIKHIYFSPALGEIYMIMESTPEKNARLSMVVFSSGTFTDGSIIDLMTTEDMTAAMKDAGTLLGTYTPANA